MDGSLVFSLGEGLVVERVEYEATTLTVFVASTALVEGQPTDVRKGATRDACRLKSRLSSHTCL